MTRFAEKFVSYLEKRNVIGEKDRDIYVYGAENALYTFISTLGLLLVGLLLKRLPETAILILLFYTNQSIGGGFHAKTHMGCFVTMIIGLLAYLAMLQLPYNQLVCIVIFCCAFAVLMALPLILHPNKKYLAAKSAVFAKRSRLIVLLQAVIFIAIVYLDLDFWIHCFSFSLGICALSRVVAVIIDRLKKQVC